MIEVKNGDIVVFEAHAVTGPNMRHNGTAMGCANGLVLVAVHDVFASSGNGFIWDKNLLPVMAVRVGSIIAVKSGRTSAKDNRVSELLTDWQGEKR